MRTIIGFLDQRSSQFVAVISALMVVVLTLVIWLFLSSLQLEVLYVVPIAIASWYGTKLSGATLVVVSVAAILLIAYLRGVSAFYTILVHSFPYIMTFISLAVLVTSFRRAHRVEVVAAETDSLTNVCNARGFYVELANELVRSTRYKHQFSLAFLDVDNFKLINDTNGHAAGDKLLEEIAGILKISLRSTDTVSRIGGDEFACLLPETEQEEAKAAFSKVSEMLRSRMRRGKWPVTFSVGMVTFEVMPEDIKEAMRIADQLMYSVKNTEKNNVSYKIWRGKM